MLIPELELEKIFNKIIKNSPSGSTSVSIMAAYDIDSLCSSHMLMVIA